MPHSVFNWTPIVPVDPDVSHPYWFGRLGDRHMSAAIQL
jgi:hypothetical protein